MNLPLTSLQAFAMVQVLLSLAIFLQHLENIKLRNLPRLQKAMFQPKVYTGILVLGLFSAALVPCLFWISTPSTVLVALHLFLFISIFSVALSFGGNFNGGADQMTVQISLATLIALVVILIAPEAEALIKKIALLYIAVQLSLSYFVSGLTKIKNVDWRSGKALQEVLRSRNYDVAGWAKGPIFTSRGLCRINSWAVMLVEILFPVTLVKPQLAPIFLAALFLFHLGNFAALGLNRFVFIWLAAYPAMLAF